MRPMRRRCSIVNGTPASFGQTFAFTGDLGTFLLPEQGSPPLSGQHVVHVAPGRYTVTQSPSPSQAALWPRQGLTCTGSAGASTDLAHRSVTVVVKPGDSVTCTFTNGPGGLGAPGPPSTGQVKRTVHVEPSFNPQAVNVKPRINTTPSAQPTAVPAITPGTAGGTGTPGPAGEALPATSGVSPAGGFSRLWLLLALGILALILFVLFLLWRRRKEEERRPSP